MGKRGPMPGTGGRPKKPLADKISEGNRGHRKMEVIDFGNESEKLEGEEMPPIKDFLKDNQKIGIDLYAEEIYKETWEWLSKRGCAVLVSPFLLQRYAMSSARWIQCEKAVSQYGFLAKHPTTGNAIASPYVAMSRDFMSQTNRLWAEVYQIVRENCSSEFVGATPQNDVMERLLRTRKDN
ncbi:MAG: terminase [Peptostreptococcaceae bacterium]|nr:terminase [Peptostreptococcaceae bacterium]